MGILKLMIVLYFCCCLELMLALSPIEFARVTVDGAGVLHDQRLTFSVGGEGATVQISEEGADSIVATRTGAPASPVDWGAVAILLTVAAGGAAVGWWRVARARRVRRSEPAALTPDVGPVSSRS